MPHGSHAPSHVINESPALPSKPRPAPPPADKEQQEEKDAAAKVASEGSSGLALSPDQLPGAWKALAQVRLS